MTERIKELIGKNIFVILKSNRRYTGMIDGVDGNIIFMTDKFGEAIMFNISEISSLEIIKDGTR